MYGIIPEGQPRRSWVQYEDGTFEPVSEHENIRLKKREPNATDWWTVTRPPEWRPAKYSTTKRGRKGMQELGTDPGVKTMEYRPPVDDTPTMEFSDLFMPPMTGEKPKGPYKTKLGTPTLLGMTREEFMPILAGLEEKEEREKKERAARTGVALMKSEGAGGAGKAAGADRAGAAKPAQPSTGPRNSARDARALGRAERRQLKGRMNVDHRKQEKKSGEAYSANDPSSKAVPGASDYYEKRAKDYEARNPGKNAPGYYRDYGDKYLKRFENLKPELSKKGQRWLDRTKVLLQSKMEKGLRSGQWDESKPEDFKRKAYDSHSEAYLEAGLANLPAEDIKKIVSVVDRVDMTSQAALLESGEVLWGLMPSGRAWDAFSAGLAKIGGPNPEAYDEVEEALDTNPYVPWSIKY